MGNDEQRIILVDVQYPIILWNYLLRNVSLSRTLAFLPNIDFISKLKTKLRSRIVFSIRTTDIWKITIDSSSLPFHLKL